MADLDASWAAYRNMYAMLPAQGIETEGFWTRHEFVAAAQDPQSAVVAAPCNDIVLPVLTPVRNLPYVNEAYYRSLAPGDRPIYYYSHLPQLLEAHMAEVAAVMRPSVHEIASRQGLIIYDAPEARIARTDAEFYQLMSAIGGVAMSELTEGRLVHFHYASEARPVGPPDARLPLDDLPGLYTRAVAAGALVADADIAVLAAVDAADVSHIWEVYDRAHQKLSEQDGMLAGFNQAEFADVMGDPAFTKFIYRLNGQIANMTIVAAESVSPQFNTTFYRRNYPHIPPERILYGVGAITDKAAPGRRSLLGPRTIRALGSLVYYAGGEAVITMVSDVVSNRNLPRITHMVLGRADLGLDFSKPVGRQVSRAQCLVVV